MPDVLLDPAILFFLLGMFAGLIRSNLDVPKPVVQWLTLYLLMSVGLKGGFTLARYGLGREDLAAIAGGLVMAVLIPFIAFAAFRLVVSSLQAGALAASYGSVSVVTFVAAAQHLDLLGIGYGGAMSVTLVLMEMPGVLIGVALARRGIQTEKVESWFALLRESLRDGAPVLLLGSLIIGWVTGERGEGMMQPFSGALFKGMLALFLLQMGLEVSRRLGDLRELSYWIPLVGLAVSLAGAGIALTLGMLLGLSAGNLALLATLAASASYIVAPAVLRLAVPDALPALYMGLPMGVTFPFNIVIGIGLYTQLALYLTG